MCETDVLKSYECMNACILNHVSSVEMKINGSDIFFAGEGYPISYKKGSLTEIKSDAYNANFRFLKKYGFMYSFHKVDPTIDSIKRMLQKSYTITIHMMSDFLTYDRVFLQSSGASHFINVLDYDQKQKKLFIVDGSVPTMEKSSFSGWVDEKDIMRGWQVMQGEVLNVDLKHNLLNTGLLQGIRNDANAHVLVAIKKYLDGKSSILSSYVTGEQAICFLMEQLRKKVKKKNFRELIQEVNFRLRVDGYIGAKKFMAEKFFEQEFRLAMEYSKIVDDWSRWCMLLLKSGIGASEKNIILVQSRMQELVERERKVFEIYIQDNL